MTYELKDYVALYAATLSSITAFWQVRNAVRDRATLRVTVRRAGRILSASIINVGRRPITVERLRVRYRPKDGNATDLDAMPQERVDFPSGNSTYADRPRELREMQPLTIGVSLPEELFAARLVTIDVMDSSGRVWRPPARNLRQLRADIASITTDDLEELFHAARPKGHRVMQLQDE